MNDARAALFNRNIGMRTDDVASDCAGSSHAEWLAALKAGDAVVIRNGGLHFRAELTDDTPCFLFIGRLKYRRSDGWQTATQRKRVYRMGFRLVRGAMESFE